MDFHAAMAGSFLAGRYNEETTICDILMLVIRQKHLLSCFVYIPVLDA